MARSFYQGEQVEVQVDDGWVPGVVTVDFIPGAYPHQLPEVVVRIKRTDGKTDEMGDDHIVLSFHVSRVRPRKQES